MTEYSPALNPLFFIPTGIIVILDLLSFPIYLKWIRAGQIRSSRILFFLKPFSILICVYFLFTQFGAGAFLGAIYCLIAPVMALGMLLFLWSQARPDRQKNTNPSGATATNLGLGILLIISTALPSFLFRPISNWCANANSAKIPSISRAVAEYYLQEGQYPKKIDNLVPEFLSSIPEPSCSLLSGSPRKFEFNNCEPPYVFVQTIDFVGRDLYSLEDGSITHGGSFLDGMPDLCP